MLTQRLPVLAVILCCLSAQSQAATFQWQAPLLQQHPLSGLIYDLSNNQIMSATALLVKLQQADKILIGEKHDNKDHHQLEKWLISKLANPERATVFEMLSQQQQLQLAQVSASDSLAILNKKLNWHTNRWPWQDYGELFQQVLQNKAPLIAGGLSRSQIMPIYSQGYGTLTAPFFNTGLRIKPTIKARLLDQIEQSHCGLMPRKQLKPMVNIQLAKDALMAHKLLKQPKAMLIAGNFHVNKQLGVPAHLRQYLQGKKTAVLALKEVEAGQTKPGQYLKQQDADYVWFTPKQNTIDHCQQLKQQLKQS